MKYFVEKVMKAHSSSWGADFHKARVQYAGIKKIDYLSYPLFLFVDGVTLPLFLCFILRF